MKVLNNDLPPREQFLVKIAKLDDTGQYELHKWLHDNYIDYSRMSRYYFYVTGKSDATLMKLRWG
jgi:hypothetical protein